MIYQESEVDSMDELLNQIQGYIKAYKEPPYGREVEGTTEILEKASQTLVKTAHRVVLLENQFVDGMKVKYQGDDEMDGIECPICKYEVATNDDYAEMRPKHCPECGTKLIYQNPMKRKFTIRKGRKVMDRKEYLLRQVLKLFKQQKESHYVLNIEEMTVMYDGAECDGSCLCDDIMEELGIDSLEDIEDEKL